MSKDWLKENWSDILENVRKWLLIPLCTLCFYCGKSYLQNNYVDRPYFDKAMAQLAEDKQRYAVDQKQELREINAKLDMLLQNQAANTQRLTDTERRLSRLEDRAERTKN